MSIDVDKIKSRLSSLKSKASHKKAIWKPAPGKNRIRIVPSKYDKSNPFIELRFHYGFNGKNLLSPASFGDPDPILEAGLKFKGKGTKEDWKIFKKLDPKLRVYVPVIVRGEEEQGVKYWGFGVTVYTQLLEFISDEDYGDITDPIKGRDIVLNYQTPEETGKQFPTTSILPKPVVTPITDNGALLKKILTDQVKITDIYKVSSYEDLEFELDKFLNPDDEEDEDKEVKNSKGAESVDDVMSDFDKLMEE